MMCWMYMYILYTYAKWYNVILEFIFILLFSQFKVMGPGLYFRQLWSYKLYLHH